MQKRIYGWALALWVLLLLVIPSWFAQAGFGVSPPLIEEEHLVPGATLKRTIYLVQGNPEVDLPAEIVVDARDIKDWFSFDTGTEFVIPAGVQQFPLEVTVTVPEDADLNVYTAFIRIETTAPPAQEGGTVAVAFGGRIDVELTVGDDIFVSYEIKAINIPDIKEGKPLEAEVRIENMGNVPVAPDSATFELFDKFGGLRLGFATADHEQFDEVPPFSEEDITLEFPLDVVIAPGEYWGHVRVFDEDGSQRRELRTVFNVHERTFLDMILIPALVTGGVVVLLVIGYTAFKMFRRRRARSLSNE